MMEMKSKLCLRITLLINHMMEKNLCVYVEWSPVKHAASRFQKESDTWMPRWTDISGPGRARFLFRSSMYYSMQILQNPI